MKNKILSKTLIILVIFSLFTMFAYSKDYFKSNTGFGIGEYAYAQNLEKQEIVDKEEVKEDLAVEQIEEKQTTKLEQVLRTPKTTIIVFSVTIQILVFIIAIIIVVNIVKKRKYYKNMDNMN